MTANAYHTLTQGRPAAQTALPTVMHVVYSVLARRDQRWQTVMSQTDSLAMARDAMNRASDSGQYDRVVIARGHSINKTHATQWKTVECALPRQLVMPSQFQTLVDDLQRNAANTPHEKRAFYLVGAIELCNAFLMIAGVIAALNTNIMALFAISFLALCEAALLSDTRPLRKTTTDWINRTRYWGYAVLIGGLVLQWLQA